MEASLESFAQTVLAAVQSKNWQAVAALVLIFAVFVLRKFAKKIPGKVGEFLLSDRGGSVLVAATSFLGMVATALLAHKALSLDLMLKSLMVAASASGARNIAWDLLAPSDKQKPADPDKTPPSPPPVMPSGT